MPSTWVLFVFINSLIYCKISNQRLNMKLLLFPAILLIISTLTVDGAVIHDTSGNALKPGGTYYVKSIFRGAAGGSLYPNWCKTFCPLIFPSICQPNVAQTSSDLDEGVPVIFTPANTDDNVVQYLSDVSIKFHAPTICTVSTVWQLAKADNITGERYVTIGGVPGKENTWFKIQKSGKYAYKLVYCPSDENTCSDLGIYYDKEVKKRWLALSDTPFEAVFIKSNIDGHYSTSTLPASTI